MTNKENVYLSCDRFQEVRTYKGNADFLFTLRQMNGREGRKECWGKYEYA